MDKTEEYQLRFPVGEFNKPVIINAELITKWIETINLFPKKLIEEVESLTDEQLSWKYRPSGWNIKQVVHHCADSHINSFMRFKLTLTEERPTIRPYYEDRWAELEDAKNAPLEYSIKILEGIHARWTILLNNLSEQDLQKTFLHPEGNKEITVAENIGIYAWHCEHHLSHISLAKQSKEK